MKLYSILLLAVIGLAAFALGRVDSKWNWGWKNKWDADSVVTDAEGRFAVPLVAGRSLTLGLLSHQPAIDQRITVQGSSGEVVLWSHVKMNS